MTSPQAVVRRVRFTTEEQLDAVPLPVRSEAAALAPGVKVSVELGARWTTENGKPRRVAGQWVECIVVAETRRELLLAIVP